MAKDITKLSEPELQRFLKDHPGWQADRDSIVRTYEFQKFLDGVRFVDKVAEIADREDHHPDIDVRYRKVTLRLTSHDAGGLTPRDPKLATLADQAYRS